MNEVAQNPNETIGKLSVPAKMNDSFGYYYLDLDKIIYLESSNNKTTIHFKDGKSITVIKVLKYFENKLSGKPFLRIHASFIINVRELYKYNKGKRKYVVLTNGEKIDVSRSKQNVINDIVDKLAIPNYEGTVYIDFKSIIYLEASHDTTIIYLSNGQSLRSIKNIGYFEAPLSGKPFYRIHDKYIINLMHVTKYYRGSNKLSENKGRTSGYVELSTGAGLPVSNGKKEMFQRFFNE